MFERETRREKILEARNKELRLKEKTKGILNLGGGGGIMNITSGSAAGAKEGGGDNKFGKAALTAFAKPPGSAEDKKDAERIDAIVGDDSKKDAGRGKDKDKDEPDEEDPIVKAEREFFEIIKQVNTHLFIADFMESKYITHQK